MPWCARTGQRMTKMTCPFTSLPHLGGRWKIDLLIFYRLSCPLYPVQSSPPLIHSSSKVEVPILFLEPKVMAQNNLGRNMIFWRTESSFPSEAQTLLGWGYGHHIRRRGCMGPPLNPLQGRNTAESLKFHAITFKALVKKDTGG